MTDGERITMALVLSVAIHWSVLASLHPAEKEEPVFSDETILVDLPLSGPELGLSLAAPIVLEQDTAAPTPTEGTQSADAAALAHRREVLNHYLDQISQTVHTKRRIAGVGQTFVGNALVSFTIATDGSFQDIYLRRTSGIDALDKDALGAVRAASATLPRPNILGKTDIPITLAVKYQFGL